MTICDGRLFSICNRLTEAEVRAAFAMYASGRKTNVYVFELRADHGAVIGRCVSPKLGTSAHGGAS
jgi:hypothetical protein